MSFILVLSTSCNKERDCTCKTKITENGTVTSETSKVVTTNDKCDDLDMETTDGSTVTEIDCDDD